MNKPIDRLTAQRTYGRLQLVYKRLPIVPLGQTKRILDGEDVKPVSLDFGIPRGDFEYAAKLTNHTVFKSGGGDSYCFDYSQGIRVHMV